MTTGAAGALGARRWQVEVRAVPVHRVAVMLGAVAMAALTWGSVRGGVWVDLDVYLAGSRVLLEGGSPYEVSVGGLPFTYPPFGAVALAPLTVLPVGLARAVLTALGVGAVLVVVEVVRRRLGMSVAAALPLVLAGLALEPVVRTLLLGQVNALLMLLVVLDCLVLPRRYRGWLVGLAAGVKLTPAVVVLWLLAQGDRRAAARAAGAFAASVVVGALVAPSASSAYFGGGVGGLARFGDGAVTGVDNQSASAALARLLGLVEPPLALVGLTGLLAVGVAFVAARRLARAGDEVGALLVVAVGGLLASPVSWSHHWIWFVPLLLWLVHRRHLLLAGAVAVTSWLAPFMLLHRWPPQPEPWAWSARLVALAYVVLGVAVLGVAARRPGRVPAGRPSGPTLLGRSDSAAPNRPGPRVTLPSVVGARPSTHLPEVHVPQRARSAAMPRPGVRRAGGRERGAVSVETAFIVVVLFAIVLGVVETATFFRNTYEISSASRSGARAASAQPMATDFARQAALQAASGMGDLDATRIVSIWVYKASLSTGAPVGGAACASSCVKFTVSSSGVPSAGSGGWSGRNACASGTVDSVGVQVQYRNKSPFPPFDEQLITERTVMRLEQLPSTVVCVST
ncbi:MAG: glycosyltransferase 87 family protein [Phycicoccus sp.]